MKRLTLLALASLALIAAPADMRGQQASQPTTSPQASMMHMMGTLHGNDQKIDELVKKMNAAKGEMKIDLMAELLTVLAEDRQTAYQSMGSNMSMMMGMMTMRGSMGAMHAPGETAAPPK